MKGDEEDMSIDDLKRMNQRLQTRQKPQWHEYPVGTKFEQKPRWNEEPAQPKRTWSHKNIIPNAKKYGGKFIHGYTKVQKGLASTFPGIADGSFEKQLMSDYNPGMKKKRRR